uniref:C-type lectin domain-containing protein n=1 Tax=Xenopus tropicalis TaxID=8364 RepID=A0A803J731_XENTR
MMKVSRGGDPGTYYIWQGGGRTTLRRNHSAGQRDFPIHWHKMDRGKYRSDFDNDIYENIHCTEEPTEPARMMKIQQEPKEGNLSSKVLKLSETLRAQRRLLVVLVTLLVLVFMFLIILTCLMFIYYSTVSRKLDEEKVNLRGEITTINKTLDGENANLTTQITAIKHTVDEQKANLLTQITSIKQTLDSRISAAMNSIKQDILLTMQKERPQCDSGWKAFDGSCYYIVTTQKNWVDAQAICKSKNSDLVIVNSDRKKNFIESITDNSYFWIGLKRDNKDKDEWRWVDGTYYNPPERFWMKGEPNNGGGKEDCVHMWKEKKWNDVYCTDQFKAICEKN